MQYIVFDLEFNQGTPAESTNDIKCPFEILQVGAVKLDENFNTLSVFNDFVKPVIFSSIDPFVEQLTHITLAQVIDAPLFSAVYDAFVRFIGSEDSILCVWGLSDIKELYRNVNYHHLDPQHIPNSYLNIQPFVTQYLQRPKNTLVSLTDATDLLSIEKTLSFHDAQNDAFYTGEVLKKIYCWTMTPTSYHTQQFSKTKHLRQKKKVVNMPKLLSQFEKMYAREMTPEEKSMIKLAYEMGKTHQFINEY